MCRDKRFLVSLITGVCYLFADYEKVRQQQ